MDKKPRTIIDGIPVWCAYDDVVSVDKLLPNPRNPNTHPADQIKLLGKVICSQGWRGPITVSTRSGQIVRGHGRRLAAIKAGLKTCPVDYQYYESEAAEWADLIADNKIAEYSEFNTESLQAMIIELEKNNIDFEHVGFLSEDIDKLLSLDGDKIGEDDIPEIEDKTKPMTSHGDVWLLGEHRLLCGEAEKTEDVANLMGKEKAAMVFTDPPYNVNYTGGTKERLKIQNDSMKKDDFNKMITEAYRNMFLYTIEGGGAYICHADQNWDVFRCAFVSAGWVLKQCLIWVKNNIVLGRQDYHWQHEPILYGWKPGKAHKWYGRRNKSTVIEDSNEILSISEKDGQVYLEINTGSQHVVLKVSSYEMVYNDDEQLLSIWRYPKPLKSELHPTMKPVALVERAIKNSSRRGDSVLDIFGGSGSTMIACEKTGRKSRMMEKDPVYCDVIVKR